MHAITKVTGLIVLVTAGFFAVQAGTAFAGEPNPADGDGVVESCEVGDCEEPEDDDFVVPPMHPCDVDPGCPDDGDIEAAPPDDEDDPAPADDEGAPVQPEDADDTVPPEDEDEAALPEDEAEPTSQDGPDQAAEEDPTDQSPVPPPAQASARGGTGGASDSTRAAQDPSGDGGFWSPALIGLTLAGVATLLVVLLIMARRRSQR